MRRSTPPSLRKGGFAGNKLTAFGLCLTFENPASNLLYRAGGRRLVRREKEQTFLNRLARSVVPP